MLFICLFILGTVQESYLNSEIAGVLIQCDLIRYTMAA